MSRRLDVLQAVCQLVAAALPSADVVGTDNDDAAPARIGAGGRAVIRSGDPGEPEVTLGVLSYSYSHRIPIELDAYATDTLSREQAIDEMAEAIGAAVEADRTLGGLVEFLDIEAMTTDDLTISGGKAARSADLAVIAEYTVSNPLL
jgi:hypothetical protein